MILALKMNLLFLILNQKVMESLKNVILYLEYQFQEEKWKKARLKNKPLFVK